MEIMFIKQPSDKAIHTKNKHNMQICFLQEVFLFSMETA